MKDRIFFDTNIWIYLYSKDIQKKQITKQLLSDEFSNLIVSTQILNELINVLTNKLKLKTKEEVQQIVNEIIQNFAVKLITEETIKKAMEISIHYQYRYFDSLMVASALQQKCKIFYTEDLNDGQVIENMKIINPFNK